MCGLWASGNPVVLSLRKRSLYVVLRCLWPVSGGGRMSLHGRARRRECMDVEIGSLITVKVA